MRGVTAMGYRGLACEFANIAGAGAAIFGASACGPVASSRRRGGDVCGADWTLEEVKTRSINCSGG